MLITRLHLNQCKHCKLITIFTGAVVLYALSAAWVSASTPVSGQYMMFRLADEYNDKKAQYIVGRKYMTGTGVSEDMEKAVQYFTRSADQGYFKAQYQLGKMYLYGEGVPTNFLAAYDLLEKAVAEDHTGAKYELANLLFHDKYGRRDTQRAIKLYKEAAEERLAGAQYMLGIIYYEGKYIDQDKAMGEEYLRLAVEHGEKRARKYLDKLEVQRQPPVSVAKAPAQAPKTKPAPRPKTAPQPKTKPEPKPEPGTSPQFDLALQNAKGGDVDSQYVVGMAYLQGDGVDEDPLRSVTWLRKAAEQDHAGAQYQLGRLYRDGVGVAKSESEAIKWFRLSASWGVSNAQRDLESLLRKQLIARGKGLVNNPELRKPEHQYILGMMYVNGKGVEKDPALAAQWLLKAAQQNHLEAQYQLGEMYQTGLGVKPDKEEARMWLAKAADGGLGKASEALKKFLKAEDERLLSEELDALNASPAYTQLQDSQKRDAESNYQLGINYLEGNGVNKNLDKAIHHLQLAAEDGNLQAQLKLGDLFLTGLVAEKDYFAAAKWFRKAAEQGNAEAQYNLGNLYRKGQGVIKSNTKAVKWYRLAAKQGHLQARNRLGGCRIC